MVTGSYHGAKRIRERVEDLLPAIQRVAHGMIGPDGASDDNLAAAVAALSHAYTKDRSDLGPKSRDRRALAARLRFFFPRDAPKVGGPLGELAAARALPQRSTYRLLDLGAGLGATSLGAALFLLDGGWAREVEIVAVDEDPRALDIAASLAEAVGEAVCGSLRLRTHRADLRSPGEVFGATEPFDLVLAGLVLNELHPGTGAGESETAVSPEVFQNDAARSPGASQAEHIADWLGSAGEALAADGSLIVLEPALRATSRSLHAARDVIVARAGDLSVFAPCLRGGGCPMLETDRHWCHEDLPLALPDELVAAARAAGLRYEGLTFSYLTLRRDGRSLREPLDGLGGEPYRIVSGPRPSKGKLELHACGAPGKPVLMRLDRHRSPANERLDELGRGSLVVVDPGRSNGDRVRIHPDTRVAQPEDAAGGR
jgi:SAM-dependent methyltransferase